MILIKLKNYDGNHRKAKFFTILTLFMCYLVPLNYLYYIKITEQNSNIKNKVLNLKI